MTSRAIAVLLAGLTTLVSPMARSQELTTGAIEGVVADSEGSPIAGAMVVVSSDEGTKTETTDGSGRFRFRYLPAGTYQLNATADGFMTRRYEKIDVRLSSQVPIHVTLERGAMETVLVTAKAPVIELDKGTLGASITDQLMAAVPLGRTVASAVSIAPNIVESGMPGSAQSNPSSGGASGLENTMIVDGININSPGFGAAGGYNYMYGSLGTGVNFDYIKEVQVKTGGYGPEFGEALGGYINVVTKTGGNRVEGSTFGYFQSDDMQADYIRTDRVNASSDVVGSQITDFGVEVGGPFVADKAFWYVAFDPTFISLTRRTSKAIIESQGVDNTLTSNRTIYNYAGNVKWLVTPEHTVTVSAFGDPALGRMGPQRPGLYGDDPLAVANPVARFSEIDFGGHNAAVRWEGRILPQWFGEASIAYHRDTFDETLALSQPQGFDLRPLPDGVPINYGGVGYGHDSESRNTQYNLKFSNYVERAGQHHFRYGLGYQDIGHDNTTTYSGNPIPFITETGDTLMSSTGFIWQVTPDSIFQITRTRVGPVKAETSARYTSFFVSDTWSPTEYLSLMAGVRYEETKLIGNLTDFTWNGNWAPRAHVAWDPTRDNKSKISFAYGRFFGKIPNQIAVRTLSSELTYILSYDLSNVDLSDPANPRITGPARPGENYIFGDQPGVVDPDSKLPYQDEYIVEVEREIQPFFSLGLSYMHRRLGRALEDVALVPYSTTVNTGEFGEYYITNPTPELGFPTPSRKYNAVTLKLDKRWHQKWQLLSAYTWSRLKGNYEGYFRRDNHQPDPAMTSIFDWPYLNDPSIFKYLIDEGVLPNDRTHVFNLYGSYSFDFNLDVGLGARIQSGVPITRMGYNIPYASWSEIPLEPRGASGRTPTTGNVGVHLDYSFLVGGGSRLELIFDVFNLFNERDGIAHDSAYEIGGVVDPDPSIAYDPVNNPNGVVPCPGCVNPDFGKPILFQNPRRLRLAVRSRF